MVVRITLRQLPPPRKNDYLHNWQLPLRNSDHLGSVSVATKADGTLSSRQEFDPWGSAGDTTHNYIGQRLDGTGQLLFQYAEF